MSYITVYKEVEIEVDLSDFDDDEIKNEYEERFGSAKRYPTVVAWTEIYEKRRSMTAEEFLNFIDPVIMDMSGRII